jgi:hypothetical protein
MASCGLRRSSLSIAAFYYWIDLLGEVPILLGVLVTGGLLLRHAWPPSTLLSTKVICGLIVIALNAWCALVVIARHRRAGGRAELLRSSHHVRWFARVGWPFFVVAAYLGIQYFRG